MAPEGLAAGRLGDQFGGLRVRGVPPLGALVLDTARRSATNVARAAVDDRDSGVLAPAEEEGVDRNRTLGPGVNVLGDDRWAHGRPVVVTVGDQHDAPVACRRVGPPNA